MIKINNNTARLGGVDLGLGPLFHILCMVTTEARNPLGCFNRLFDSFAQIDIFLFAVFDIGGDNFVINGWDIILLFYIQYIVVFYRCGTKCTAFVATVTGDFFAHKIYPFGVLSIGAKRTESS